MAGFRNWLLMAALTSAGAGLAQGVAKPPAASPPRYDTEVFAEVPATQEPELSPNGKMIAGKIAVNGNQYFSILSLDTGKRRLIGAGEVDLNWWQWVNDDWLVIGVGRLVPVEGDDWYIRRAVSVPVAGGKLVDLGAREGGQNADDVLWFANDGSPRILMASQSSIYRNETGFWPHVREIDVSTGKGKVVQVGRDGVWNWYADGSGTVRMGIGTSDDGRNRRVLYRNSARDGYQVIDRARTHFEGLTVPTLFLREPGKALTIADDEDGYSALYELDVRTLERGKQLFATKGYDIGGLRRDATGYGYVGISVLQEQPGVVWTDPEMAAMQKAIADQIKNGSPRIVSLSRDHQKAIVHVGGADAPGAYFVYDRADASLTMLGANNSTIGMKRLHPVRTIRYKARDGLEIAAVLTLPRADTTNAPLIVMPHGGPFARDSEEWDWWTQFLANRGYVVVQPNYRGSSGYGTPFTEKGAGQWGLAMQDDLNDVVTALTAQGIADPKRVCMVGASYGGYAAMRAAQRDGGLYRCAVSYAGVSDLNRMQRHDSSFLGAGARKDWLKMQAPDLKGVSPINFAKDFSIPMLIVHGKKDRVVPIAQSRELVEDLRATGKNVTYIEQPEADHYFTRGEDRLQFLKALETFLAAHNPV
ncbi:alpha/beta hydrolase family protein [Sphingomonas sp. 37zxx]|uniref:alpha/beta hydrolase family protein n=1 Tax=Sphingomonas sp. 37zxx TaxID=1550073 RepID=UPI00053BF2B7|nr:alpha/beta fold hydrolase [Sphingomonas sp. 37zxx]